MAASSFIVSLILFSIIIMYVFNTPLCAKRCLDFEINTKMILSVLSLFLVIVFYYFVGKEALFSLVFVVITLWALLLGFIVSERYIYITSSVIFGIVFVSLLFGLNAFAEKVLIPSYLLLVLGVLKGLFYEKIFEE